MHQKYAELQNSLFRSFSSINRAFTTINRLRGIPTHSSDTILNSLLQEKTSEPLSIQSFATILVQHNFSVPEELEAPKPPQINDFSVHINDAKIRVLSKTLEVEEFSKGNLGNSSSCLCLDQNTIIFTGRWAGNAKFQKQAHILNLRNGNLKAIGSLNVGRGFHSMSWIDGKPAVIGGKNADDEKMDSVEVLDGNKWAKIASLSIARDNHSSCATSLGTYVFGGWVSLGGDALAKTDTVEKYFGGQWAVLGVKLNVPSARVGAVSRDGKEVLLFGGIGNQNAPLKSVWKFSDWKVEAAGQIERACCFEYSMFVVDGGMLHGMERTGTVLSHKLS